MVKTNQQSYTYLIKFIPTGQLYYGVRWGNKVAPEEDLWKKYFTSSKYIKKLINDYGSDCFDYQIRRVFNNKNKARLWEETVLKRMKVVEKDVWLNKTDNHSILNNIDSLNKMKETNLKRYGVKNAFQSEEIKEKIRDANIEKYGVAHPAQSEVVKQKTKETMLERYGVEHYSQTNEYKKRYKNTIKIKHGVEHYSKTDEYVQKTKETMLNKYGVDNYSKTQEYKNKTKKTCLKKYGVENPFQSEDIKQKIKKTNLEKYGVENPSQNEEINKKLRAKYKCNDCEFKSTKSCIVRHQNKTGHKNFCSVEEEV